MGLQDGGLRRETVLWLKEHKIKNLRRTLNPNHLFVTSDLSVEGASKGRISLQSSIKYHFCMNFLQISLTEPSTEKCFCVGWRQMSVPPIVCEALRVRPICPNEILSSGTYTSPQEVTDQSEIQTCLLNVMQVTECSLQGNTRLVSYSFFGGAFSSLCCTSQSWAHCVQFHMISGYSRAHLTVLSVCLSFGGERCQATS